MGKDAAQRDSRFTNADPTRALLDSLAVLDEDDSLFPWSIIESREKWVALKAACEDNGLADLLAFVGAGDEPLTPEHPTTKVIKRRLDAALSIVAAIDNGGAHALDEAISPGTLRESIALRRCAMAIVDSLSMVKALLLKPGEAWRTSLAREHLEKADSSMLALRDPLENLQAILARLQQANRAKDLRAISRGNGSDGGHAPGAAASKPNTATIGPLAPSAVGGGSDDAMLSVAELAQMFGVKPEALRKRLERWRATRDDGWIEAANPRRQEPKYLHKVGAVRHIAMSLRASGGASGERPTKE